MGQDRNIDDQAGRAGRLVDENAFLRASLGEMRERLTELEDMADGDTLTPLPGVRRFVAELRKMLAASQRHDTPAAFLHVDVEGLSVIAARHGQPARDAALIHVARQLNGLIRSTDFAARIDDEAFGLLLDHLDHNSAIDTADRIAGRVAAAPLDLGGASVRVKVTIGVVAIDGTDTVEDLLERGARNAKLATDLI